MSSAGRAPYMPHGFLDAHAAIVERRRHSAIERIDGSAAAATAARFAPSEAPAIPIEPGRTSAGRLARKATAAPMSWCHATSAAASAGRDVPGRSMARALMRASASRCATTCQSSRGRPSIGTSTTAGAGRRSASSKQARQRAAVGGAEFTSRPAAFTGGCATTDPNTQIPTPKDHIPAPDDTGAVWELGVGRWALA